MRNILLWGVLSSSFGRRYATVYDPYVLLGVSPSCSWGEVNRKYRQQLKDLPLQGSRRRAVEQAYQTLSKRQWEMVTFTPLSNPHQTCSRSASEESQKTNPPQMKPGLALPEADQKAALLFNFKGRFPLEVLGLPPGCSLERATVRYLALGYELNPAMRVRYLWENMRFWNSSLALDSMRNPGEYIGGRRTIIWKVQRANRVWAEVLAERGFTANNEERPYVYGVVSAVRAPWVTVDLQKRKKLIAAVLAVFFYAVFFLSTVLKSAQAGRDKIDSTAARASALFSGTNK